jgi:hypothetical protein
LGKACHILNTRPRPSYQLVDFRELPLCADDYLVDFQLRRLLFQGHAVDHLVCRFLHTLDYPACLVAERRRVVAE